MTDEPSHQKNDNGFFLVLRAIYHYRRGIAAQYGLDFDQIYVLEYLRKNANIRLTEIAQEMGMPMFTASRMISRLMRDGYLDRVQDALDRRNQRITIREKGEAVLDAIESNGHEHLNANLRDFSAEEISLLKDMAEKLREVPGAGEKVIKPPR